MPSSSSLRAPGMPSRPMVDFAAGYVQRAANVMPRQSDGLTWGMSMNYFTDVKALRESPVTNPNLRFLAARRSAGATDPVALDA